MDSWRPERAKWVFSNFNKRTRYLETNYSMFHYSLRVIDEPKMSEIRILNFDFGRSSPQSLLRLVFSSRKTAPRQPSPNGLVERSVRIFEDGMKKWAHGRLCVSYLFVRCIAPVTRTHDNSNFKSYYIHIIDKLFPSTSQQMNLAKITRFFTTFLGITTSKKLHITHLFF